MKITALEEYGLRCMLSLAKNWPDKSVTMPEMSVMEGLSIPYIGKLMMILKKAGLVKAVRGRNGGYILASPPDTLHLNMIFSALGEPIYSSRHCARYSGDEDICVHDGNCNVKHMWRTFNDLINNILYDLTLADLINGEYEGILESFKNEDHVYTDSSNTGDARQESADKPGDDKSEVKTFK
jgi:Rrf2 family iron-sulfur cluster assembly transcriptional regulator